MENQRLNSGISYCGLYCETCRRFTSGKCTGCSSNSKLSWCKIRTCNIELGYSSCAQCDQPGCEQCKKLNNLIGSFFSILFNSDRIKGLKLIQTEGHDQFIAYMKRSGKMAMPRRVKGE